MELVKIEISVDTAERLAEAIRRDLNHFPPSSKASNALTNDYERTKECLSTVRSRLINQILEIKSSHTGEVHE